MTTIIVVYLYQLIDQNQNVFSKTI